MSKFDRLLKQYDFQFPSELIAQKPKLPRTKARLLVLKSQNNELKFDTFANIGKYLPINSVLVFNKTKVVPARLTVKKETGGKASLLYIDHDKKFIKVLSNRPLAIGSVVSLVLGRAQVKQKLMVIEKKTRCYYLKPNFPTDLIKSIMLKYGKTPLPPYIKNSPLTEKQKREQYQSVFAKTGLSVAAPTASLHFTKTLIACLKKRGIDIKFVTLNVNLGTFAPLKEENIKLGKLHSESYEIDKKTAASLNQAKKQGKIIIAVGTTVVRTLESAAHNQTLAHLSGQTPLFIAPGYKFKFVDSLITNFHVPKSSLLMLVSALLGRKKLLNAYKLAIKKRFRLFSFGDGMLILP